MNVNDLNTKIEINENFFTMIYVNEKLIENKILIPSEQKIICSTNSSEYYYDLITINENELFTHLNKILIDKYKEKSNTSFIFYGNSTIKEKMFIEAISMFGNFLYKEKQIIKLNGIFFNNYNDFMSNIQGNYIKKVIISIYSKEESSENLNCEFEFINLQLYQENQILDIKHQLIVVNFIDDSDLDNILISLDFIEKIKTDFKNNQIQNKISINQKKRKKSNSDTLSNYSAFQNNLIPEKEHLKYISNTSTQNFDNNKYNSFQSPLLSKINSINPSPRIINPNYVNQYKLNNMNNNNYNNFNNFTNINNPYHFYDNLNYKTTQNSILSDNIIYKEDIYRLNDMNRHLEESLNDQRTRNYDLVSDNEQLNRNHINLCNQINNLKNNLAEMKNKEKCLIDSLNIKIENEKKFHQAQNNLSNLKFAKSQIEMDYQTLFDKFNELHIKNKNEVECLNHIQEEHEKKMTEIEKKIYSFLTEIDELRKENLNLRKENEEMRQNYEKNNSEIQNINEQFMIEKIKNEKIQNEIESVKKNIKNYTLNFHDEESYNKKNEEKKKKQSINKKKLINELQKNIHNYRINRMKRNYSH